MYRLWTHLVNRDPIVLAISLMSRWLSRDVISMPLGKIEDEIAAIEKLPMRERTIMNIERLRDLHDARRRITGNRRSCTYHF
jgi:hypothetical protein